MNHSTFYKRLFCSISFVLLFSILLAPAVTNAQDDDAKVKEYAAPTNVPAGETGLLKSEGGMAYFLRIPKNYSAEKGARLIVFMHGSNMSGLDYLRTIESMKWCKSDILLCPNGEATGDDAYGANNFGFASANPVSALTKEIQKELSTTLTYIGGHSQGGFVTYSVIMHFPELYHGAFPMAGDCWMQNEPNIWEKEYPDKVVKQKKIPIAVIHGQADPVVSFSQGKHSYNVFLACGYPKIRFFNPEGLGHQFALSPVEDALDWLDAMNGHDPTQAISLAKGWIKDGEWGWAHQAAVAIKSNLDADDTATAYADKIIEKIESPSATATKAMAAKIKSDESGEWITDWYEFHRQFGATEAASKLVASYSKRRGMQREEAEKLFHEVRGHFQEKKKEEAYTKLEKLLSEFPCTYHAYYAKDWLANRTDKPAPKTKKKFR